MGLELTGSAVVTGAGGGIGRACVEQLVRDGCIRLLITDIQEASLDETAAIARNINPAVDLVIAIADVSQDGTAENLVKAAITRFGRVDYGLNVAGISGRPLPIVDISDEEYARVMGINSRAVWMCERAFISQMLKQDPLPTHDGRPGNRGAIVNIASVAAYKGLPNSTVYTMTKHAVLGLTKSDSSTYISQGIRINAVCPGIIDTPMLSKDIRELTQVFVDNAIPIKRFGRPQEVADVAAFLCSSRATFVSGASFVVDGGYLAQ